MAAPGKRREMRKGRGRRAPVDDRPHQYTVEGTIELLGDFAAGANRARGFKRLAAKAIVVLMLLPLAWSVVRLLTGWGN